MPLLTGSVSYNSLLTALLNNVPGNDLVKHLVQARLLPDWHFSYQTAIRSYEYLALYYGFNSWPATTEWLEKWAATRIMGSQVDKKSSVFPETSLTYCKAATGAGITC